MSALGNATPPTPRNAIIAIEPYGVTIRNCVIGDDGGTPDDITDDQLFSRASSSSATRRKKALPAPCATASSPTRLTPSSSGSMASRIENTDILDNDVFQGGIGVFKDSARVNVPGNRIRALVVAQTAFSGIVPSEGAYGLAPNQAGIYAVTAPGLTLLPPSPGGSCCSFPCGPMCTSTTSA